jgi:hypothetical protein
VRNTRKGFQKGAKRATPPTGGVVDLTLVYQPSPRPRRKVDPLARLREWERNNGGVLGEDGRFVKM